MLHQRHPPLPVCTGGYAMLIYSNLPKKAYISALKERRGSPFRFGSERFCGIAPGGMLYVTHHCSHEWNRRITGERNTAIGIVHNDGEGCRIRFIVIKGLLAPHYLLGLFCFCLVCFLIAMLQGSADPVVTTYALPVSLMISVFTGLGTALAESFTDQSAEGQRILHSILLDPTDPFSYLHNQNKL